MISNDYFTRQFQSISYHKGALGNDIRIDIDYKRLGSQLDMAQRALDAQVWVDIQKYMPMDTGALIAQTHMMNMATRGEVYFIPPNSDYGHYQWQGQLYVDPVYGKGAFYSPEYGFWSRKGVQKIPTSTPLKYQRDTAQAHWDEVAFDNHSSEWVDLVRRFIT